MSGISCYVTAEFWYVTIAGEIILKNDQMNNYSLII